MGQSDYEYETARDGAGVPARLTVYGGQGFQRSEMIEDLRRAGFRAISGGEVGDLLEGPVMPLGDVVIVDCPILAAAEMAGLARLDDRIAQSGTHLIVLTSLDALDAVFSILDRSKPQILIQPSRAEVIVAVGRVMGHLTTAAAVREMSEADRLSLLRLSEQIDAIAQELDRISSTDPSRDDGVSDFKRGFSMANAKPLSLSEQAKRAKPPQLPDPRLVRQMIAGRQARAQFFDAELFADPAWDMLLDLTAAHAEKAEVSVTSLCIAAGVPATTALRWLKQMVDCGIFERVADASDRRRAFIRLSDSSLDAMARYFELVDTPLARAA